MSSETAFRKYLADKMLGHISQVESHATSAGIPDTNYCLDGVEGWIECKYVVDKKRIKVRGTQKTWFRRRLSNGGRNIFLALRHESKDGRRQCLLRIKSREQFDDLVANPTAEYWFQNADAVWGVEIDQYVLQHILRGVGND